MQLVRRAHVAKPTATSVIHLDWCDTRILRSHRAAVLFLQDASSSDEAEEQYTRYCRDMGTTAAWGSQAELRALAHVLQRSIVVHSVGMPPVHMGEEYADNGPPYEVCYLRHAYGLGDHFNSCGPAKQLDKDS